MNRGGFSWNRFLGITKAKRRVSKATGIPWTKSGRQRKAGAAMGCCMYFLVPVLVISIIIAFIIV